MRRLTTTMKMSDFYCGCGGSSSGAKAAGAEIDNASNHDKLAIDTHSYNHPDTRHYLVDLLISDPRNFPYTPIAWFSPECTYHTRGKGRKQPASQLDMFNATQPDPAAQRSRVTMWDVVRFSEYHRYEVVIVENVVDVKGWHPFESWLKAMESLGYRWRMCYFNSRFFHPLNGQSMISPQNRDRLFVEFSKLGNKAPDLDFHPLAWCDGCGRDIRSIQIFKKSVFPLGEYDTTGKRGQYYYACPACTIKTKDGPIPRRVEPYYFAAANIIKWDLPITCIADRDDPLKEKTMRRIKIGLKRYSHRSFVVETARSGDPGNRAWLLSNPMPTQTTAQSLAFIMSQKDNPQHRAMYPATGACPGLILVPFLVEMYNNGDLRPASEPVNTITAGGLKTGLVLAPSMPFIISYYNGSNLINGINKPVPTISTVDRHALVIPEGISARDCFFRMFIPDECKRTQGFGDDYKIFGTNRQQVRQIGNAVSTSPAEFLVYAGIESLQ